MPLDTQIPSGFYIEQKCELYSEQSHAAWNRLYTRILPEWRGHATARFLNGLDKLDLNPWHVPKLEEINRRLMAHTGFQAKPVSGYIPAFVFFDCLRRREFPTAITIRDANHLDYLPEPDIFHDVAGHVPLHTDEAFAATLVRFGDCAHTAAAMAAGIRDKQEQLRWLTSVMKAMARFFWFTIEFGLMREAGELKAYGSGLLSSYGELGHALTSPAVQRYPLQLEWVINQQFEIDHYQPLLFVADSFDHLFELADQLRIWMRDGKLGNVAPGEPAVKETDLRSFLEA